MKVKWAKVLLMVAAVSFAPLLMSQSVFSAIRTNTQSFPFSFETLTGSFFSRVSSASEPVLLLFLGAFLIIVGVRIRQMFTREVS